jgi:hypothetical protein
VAEAVRAGAPIVFVTGGAGSGKSTLIHWLLGELAWPAAVVAPTGIAALNAGGATIHSFFKLPPRLLEPEDVKRVTDRKLYERLRLLVIDEISMVCADVMDAVCRFLELNDPEPGMPHGGVQLLLVGDLFQLPPVVEQRDLQRFFRRAYRSPHSFSAHAFRSASIVPIEMGRVFPAARSRVHTPAERNPRGPRRRSRRGAPQREVRSSNGGGRIRAWRGVSKGLAASARGFEGRPISLDLTNRPFVVPTNRRARWGPASRYPRTTSGYVATSG